MPLGLLIFALCAGVVSALIMRFGCDAGFMASLLTLLVVANLVALIGALWRAWRRK